ncbi:sensor histidine kinase [Streptococcus jiangjianxini]|uniref:sensor histidine kinase n=1 Tax=Streptococcus jiangjianxini TaxID=3161189 RepID=UPI0032EBED2D
MGEIMEFLFDVFGVFIAFGLDLFLFLFISKRKFSVRTIFIAFLLYELPLLLTSSLQNFLFLDFNFIPYLYRALGMLSIPLFFLRELPKSLLIFYGLFPITLRNLFYRSISFFLLPVFSLTNDYLDSTKYWLFFYILSAFLSTLFLRWLKYDFTILERKNLDSGEKQLLNFINIVMIVYFILIEIFTYLEFEKSLETLAYRKFLVILLLILFIGIINILDRRLRERVQKDLILQRELQLKDMETYSKRIEELYKEVRSFRHDYANLLTTLKLGIESKDIDAVNEVYQSVLKDSNKTLKDHKYDIGRLTNIKNSALKSLLAAKFIQATEKNVSISLEVPEAIEPKGMDLIDFITIVSILCDNALDAVLDATVSSINIAFFSEGNKQIFIIENSMKNESLNIEDIYKFGVSSKGNGRGVGLYSAHQIINKYPNISLKTTSHNYIFAQNLEIKHYNS